MVLHHVIGAGVLAQTTSTTVDVAEELRKALDDGGLWFGGSLWFVAFWVVYWLPALVAALRGHNLGRVLTVNVLVAWTIVGWIVALVLACTRKPSDVEEPVRTTPLPASTYQPRYDPFREGPSHELYPTAPSPPPPPPPPPPPEPLPPEPRWRPSL